MKMSDEEVMQLAKRYIRRSFALSGFENVTPEKRQETLMKLYEAGIKLRDASYANAERATQRAEEGK